MPAVSKPQLILDQTHGPVRVLVCDIAARIAAPTETDKPLPESLVVMKWGENQTAKGRVVVNDTTLRVMPAVMKASNLDRIALDFEHNTVPGHPSYQGEPAKIAAMGAPLVQPGRGLVLTALEYTADGQQFIRGKHYGDLSPVVVLNARDEVIALTSVAACRAGATPGLGITLSSSLFLTTTGPMDYKKLLRTAFPTAKLSEQATITRELCLALLGLDDDATDEEIEAAAQALAGDDEPEADPKLGNDDDEPTAEKIKTGEVRALTVSLTALAQKLAALEEREITRDRELILSAATIEGKVVPRELTEGDQALDNLQLKALVATLPVTVPLSRRVDPHARPANVIALSATEDAVRRQLGIPESAWKKHSIPA